MGTKFFIAVGVLPVDLLPYCTKFQWSLLKVDRDGSIYILDVMLG